MPLDSAWRFAAHHLAGELLDLLSWKPPVTTQRDDAGHPALFRPPTHGLRRDVQQSGRLPCTQVLAVVQLIPGAVSTASVLRHRRLCAVMHTGSSFSKGRVIGNMQAGTVAIVSFRLMAPDGVSVEADKWAEAFRALDFSVTTVAGEGPVTHLLPGLAIHADEPPA